MSRDHNKTLSYISERRFLNRRKHLESGLLTFRIITECDERCYHHGICQNGTCICSPGWNGKFCSIPGCPHNCFNRGECALEGDNRKWKCFCEDEYTGEDCGKVKEKNCDDQVDNDAGLSDCSITVLPTMPLGLFTWRLKKCHF